MGAEKLWTGWNAAIRCFAKAVSYYPALRLPLHCLLPVDRPRTASGPHPPGSAAQLLLPTNPTFAIRLRESEAGDGTVTGTTH